MYPYPPNTLRYYLEKFFAVKKFFLLFFGLPPPNLRPVWVVGPMMRLYLIPTEKDRFQGFFIQSSNYVTL